LAEPHVPLPSIFAEHDEVVPESVQFQVHCPLAEARPEAEPVLQSADPLGWVATSVPLAEPQLPFTSAEQEDTTPEPLSVQVQAQS
jgi:hypothetical protein